MHSYFTLLLDCMSQVIYIRKLAFVCETLMWNEDSYGLPSLPWGRLKNNTFQRLRNNIFLYHQFFPDWFFTKISIYTISFTTEADKIIWALHHTTKTTISYKSEIFYFTVNQFLNLVNSLYIPNSHHHFYWR